MKRKNILLIISDQHRGDTMGFTGRTGCRTPNIDQLVKKGVSFDQAICASPLCGPSRTSIFAGIYPHQAKGVLLHDNLGARGPGHPPGTVSDMMINDSSVRDEPYLTNLLKGEGYHTAYAGKWHMGNDVIENWFERAWGYNNKQYMEWLEENKYPDGWPLNDMEVRTMREPHMSIPHTKPNLIEPEIANDAWIADIAIRYLKERPKEKPFFLVCGFNGPHPPFKISEPYYSMYDSSDVKEPENFHPGSGEPKSKAGSFYRALWKDHGDDWASWRKTVAVYRGFVTYIDHQVGRLIACLEEEKVKEDTLVIYTSDHGEMLGQHGLWHKMQAYEEALRVPLIISAPWIESKRRSSAMASLIDLAPTILSTAGINPPAHYEGADLTGTFRGSDAIPSRKYVFSEHKPLGPFHGEVDLRMITDNHMKYIWNRGDTDELYNLDEDRGELNNLIGHSQHHEKIAELCGELRLELRSWMERTQDPLLNDFLKDNIGR